MASLVCQNCQKSRDTPTEEEHLQLTKLGLTVKLTRRASLGKRGRKEPERGVTLPPLVPDTEVRSTVHSVSTSREYLGEIQGWEGKHMLGRERINSVGKL